jgi:transposase
MNEVNYTCFVGIDIAADTFSAAWRSSDGKAESAICLAQTTEGFRALVQSLPSPADETLILMEATSTYWIPLATFLYDAGYAVSVVNPLQAYGFARTMLKRNKTDSIDAEILHGLLAGKSLQALPGILLALSG